MNRQSVSMLAVASCLIGATLVSLNTMAASDVGTKVFVDHCLDCHTIGEGELVGPDLSPLVDWAPGDMVDALKRMEDEEFIEPLSGDQKSALVLFMAKTDAAGLLKEASTPSEDIGEQKAPLVGDPEQGRALFFGENRFSARGMACGACHQAGREGGNLGPDLQGIGERMSHVVLVSACTNLAFPVMKAAYADHKLGEQEVVDLVAYLESGELSGEPGKPSNPILILGLLGGGLGIAGIGRAYGPAAAGSRKRLLAKSKGARS
jgi:cytochrome c2